MGPKAKDPEKNVQQCAKELGLLEPSKLSGIRRACEIINDEKTYKIIEEKYNESVMACGSKKSDILSLSQIKKMCVDADELINRFR